MSTPAEGSIELRSSLEKSLVKQQPILVTTFWMSVLQVSEHVVQGVTQSEEYRSVSSDGPTGTESLKPLAERLIAECERSAARQPPRSG